MLRIQVPLEPEKWDEKNEMFIIPETRTLQLEHSLVSISKWESKWAVPFYAKRDKTTEEVIDYIKCMTITQNVKDEIYDYLTKSNISEILSYIEAPMTATTFHKKMHTAPNRETVTSELIYHWMIELGIPMECQKWHINRLLTLVEVRNRKLQPPKKTNKRELTSQYAKLNEARRRQLNTRG